MPNKNYERGVRFEREVQDIFRKHGYEAIRTAGSHSTFDVILVKYSKRSDGVKKVAHVAFVQCKTKLKGGAKE